MLKLFTLIAAICGMTSAGYLGGYGFPAPSYAYHTAPAVVAAPTLLKTYTAPSVVAAAPVLKTYTAPVATSYANTYRVSTSTLPVVHAPAAVYKSYSAPAVLTAPAYGYSFGHGFGHGYPSFYHH